MMHQSNRDDEEIEIVKIQLSLNPQVACIFQISK